MIKRIFSIVLALTMLFSLTGPFQVASAAEGDEGIVDLDVAWLDLGNTTNVIANLTLPTAGPNGSAITWSSSGSPYLWDNGTVIRPPSGVEASVPLVATVSSGEASKTKTFTVVIPAYATVRSIANVKTAPEGDNILSADYNINVPVRTAPKLPYRVWVEYNDGYAEWRNTQWPWSGSYGSGPAGANTPAGIEQIWQSYPVGQKYTVTGWITGDNTTALGYPMTVNCVVVDGDFTMPQVNGIYAGNNLITAVNNPASFAVPETKVAKTLPITKVSLNLQTQNRLTSNVTRSVVQAATGTPWEVTRWLYNYRDSFGLSVTGYTSPTGWESPTTKLRGHGAGHYINALALTYNTGAGTEAQNQAILNKIKRFVSETRQIQEMTFWPLDWVGKGASETYQDILNSGKTWKDMEVTKWREAADTWPYDDTDKAASAPDWPYVTLENVTSSWDNLVTGSPTRERTLNARDPKWFGYGYINATPPIHLVLNERYGTYSAWVWAPYYGVHKQLAGFMDLYYSFKDSTDPELKKIADTALLIAKDMSHWISNRLTTKAFFGPDRNNVDNPKVPGTSVYGNLTNTWHTNISGEYGGINEPMVRCAAELNDSDPDKALLVAGAEMFYNKTYWDTLAANSENMSLNGNSHANSRIPQFPGALETYMLNKDPFYYVVSKNFFDFNAGRFRYYSGNVGNGEWYRAPYTQIANIGTTINETCCAMNLAKLSKELACFDPDNAEYMDYYERLTFNQLIGSVQQSNGTWGVTYQYAVGPNTSKPFGNTDPGANCCGGTGVENPSRYIESVYFTSDDTIWVNMMMQVNGDWDAAGYTISQACTWPTETSTVTMTPNAGQTQKAVAMKIRIPWWATKDVSIKLNGVEVASKYLPSSFVEIPARVWSATDKVVISQPFQKSIDYAPDKSGNYWAGTIFYGPLAMSGTGAWSVQNIAADLSNIIENEQVDYADSAANTPGNNRNVYTLNLTGEQSNTYAKTLQPDYYRDTNSTKYFRINILGAEKMSLYTIIQKAHGLLAENYSADTFANLQSVLSAGIIVYQKDNVTQSEADTQVALIQTAINNLVLSPAGKAELLDLINQGLKRKSDQEAWASGPNPVRDDRPWAPYGYARMLTRIQEAQAVYDNAEAKQLAVDTAYTALNNELVSMRIGNQYEVEDLDTLKALLVEAETVSAGIIKPVGLVSDIKYAQDTVEIITAGSSTMGEYPPPVAEKRLRDAIDLLNNKIFVEMYVDTAICIAPVLPSVVHGVNSDGSIQDLAVTWDSISPDNYAQVGNFDVNGTVAGTLLKAVAHVIVGYTYAVRYDANGGSFPNDVPAYWSETVTWDAKELVPTVDPTRKGYEFVGWKTEFDGDVTNAMTYGDLVGGNITVTSFTMLAQWKAVLQSVVPTASVKKINGNQNALTIIVTKLYYDGSTNVIETTFLIDNNAEGIYDVGDYKVYVNTKGNDQIRSINIVK